MPALTTSSKTQSRSGWGNIAHEVSATQSWTWTSLAKRVLRSNRPDRCIVAWARKAQSSERIVAQRQATDKLGDDILWWRHLGISIISEADRVCCARALTPPSVFASMFPIPAPSSPRFRCTHQRPSGADQSRESRSVPRSGHLTKQIDLSLCPDEIGNDSESSVVFVGITVACSRR
jgi:hypothetical protein